MRYAILAVFSAGISLFVFQLSIRAIYQPGNLKRIFGGWSYRNRSSRRHENGQKDGKNNYSGTGSFEDDIELLLKENSYLRIFGLRIKTIGDFHVLRIISSISIMLVFILAGSILDRSFYLLAVAAALIFYFLFLAVLKGKIASRSVKVLKELPDVIDLMASLASAGLTLDESIDYISRNFKGITGRLFGIYREKILEGKSRAEAFNIIERMSFCTEFKSFIKILYQSEIVGNPVKNILIDLSRVYRNNQRDLLKMKAERMESNLIVVIFIFIFIPMLMIFMLPAIPHLRLFFS